MSKALYTKYRPNNFEDVIGQDVAVKILKRSIEMDKINHAYLFYGVRGTGKTTLARIFAKAVNCEQPHNGNPCNGCESCNVFNNGASLDMIEIDAASHNGVDEIRELTERANYSTSSSKYKVYIIDEVHMLSKSAFNALLKTLEEPPKNTLFLFATTEINKIPDTILSRTIVLNLQLVPAAKIKEQLIKILSSENISYDEEALEYIANLADGSVRDAISLLETALLYAYNINKDNVIKVLGILDKEVTRKIILEQNIEDINLIDETINGTRLMSIFVDELVSLIKEGKTEYKALLDKLTDGLLTIKDPILLNKFIRTTLISFGNVKVSNTSSEEPINVTEEVKKEVKEIVENTVEKTIELEKEEQKLTENSNVEENVSRETIEESTPEETHEEENVSRETITENNTNETIFDHIDAKQIVFEMLAANTLLLSSIQNKWTLLDDFANDENNEVIGYLKESKPLLASDKLLIVGNKDEWMIEQLKNKSMECSTFELMKQLSNRDIAIIPVTEESWNQLVSLAKKVSTSNQEMTEELDIPSIVTCKEETTREIAIELFGDKLVNND